MRCNTAPFAPDSRSASGNVAATNGKVSRAFRRERERRSSTTGSGSRRSALRTASCWDRGALLLRRRTQTLRPGHGRNPNDLGRLSLRLEQDRARGVRCEHDRLSSRGRVPEVLFTAHHRPTAWTLSAVSSRRLGGPRPERQRPQWVRREGNSSTASSARSSPSPRRCIRERWASPVWRPLVVVAPAPTCSGEEGATSARRRQRVQLGRQRRALLRRESRAWSRSDSATVTPYDPNAIVAPAGPA